MCNLTELVKSNKGYLLTYYLQYLGQFEVGLCRIPRAKKVATKIRNLKSFLKTDCRKSTLDNDDNYVVQDQRQLEV